MDIDTANAKKIKVKLTNNDFIYIIGVNSFFLLQELERIGADKIIAQEVQAGKLCIGESIILLIIKITEL